MSTLEHHTSVTDKLRKRAGTGTRKCLVSQRFTGAILPDRQFQIHLSYVEFDRAKQEVNAAYSPI